MKNNGGAAHKEMTDGELIDLLRQACFRLLLWPQLHEQEHPEWNGNRFDDMQVGKKAIEAADRKRKADAMIAEREKG